MASNTSFAITPADTRHLAGIVDIYNDAALNTTAIWNDQAVDVANRRAWMEQRRALGYPVIVAVDNAERVIGYASFGDFRAFDGYRFTVEHSVYVHRDARRRGVARALMTPLIAHASALGKHVMVGAIESGNVESIALHASLGFIETGHMPQVGFKFGRWLDLTLMQKTLETPEPAQRPISADA